MTRLRTGAAAGGAGVFAAIALAVLWNGAPSRMGPVGEAGRRATVYPDYRDATIPPNIAPLNAQILEEGTRYRLRVSGARGEAIEVANGSGRMRLPAEKWKALVEANRGGAVTTDIFVKGAGGWTHFETARNPVAAEEIDPYVVYRYIPPIYDKWGNISIRQRDLRSFAERIVFDNERSADASGATTASACVNCHTFRDHRTDEMLLHARPSHSGQIPAMIVARGGRAEKVDTRTGGRGAASYASWHPGGKLIAFSRNSLLQIFHTAGAETRDVIDRDSDLGLYDVEAGRTFTVPSISRPDRMETWPTWSPDGRYLYFSSATRLPGDRRMPPPNWKTIRYDLARVSFDAATGRWGEAEIVVSGDELGKSISEPQVSPDGRYVLFTAHEYGSFPIFQPSADLYLADVGGARSLPVKARRADEIDSDRADSYHSWSSNGRWVIFSSKREDGVFTRLYIARFNPDGSFGRPFVMPQEDPEFYRRCAMVFNRPELVVAPVSVSEGELARAIRSGPGADTGTVEEPYRGPGAGGQGPGR